MRNSAIIIFMSLLTACGGVGGDSFGPDEPLKIDNGDGTFSYALTSDFDPDERVVIGNMTWRYVGQARFDWDPQPIAGPVAYMYEGDLAPDLEDQLLNTYRTDDEGRLWVVESYDEAAIIEGIARVGADEEPATSAEFEAGYLELPEADAAPEPEIGAMLTWEPLGWTKTDCNSDGKNDLTVWDGESRKAVSSPSAPRQRTIVKVSSSVGGCTGTVLRNRWVLTAAHCVVTNTNNIASSISVRNYAGEFRSVPTSGVYVGSGYRFGSNGWDPNDDYALLKYSSSFNTSTGDMDISSISDSTINTVDDRFHNLGYPARFPGCTYNYSLVHSWNNEITGKNSKNIRWKGDGGPGHSGGPLYYCPGSPSVTACDSNDTGFVVAVVSGFSGYYNRLMGPRGANFKSWAVSIMDNN